MFHRLSIASIVLALAIGACSSPSHPDAAADAPPIDGTDAIAIDSIDNIDAPMMDTPTQDTPVLRDVVDTTDAPRVCASDTECSDGVFCNGAERCLPGSAGADPRGCAPPSPATPCTVNETCNEAMDRCDNACATAGDADGDHHLSMMCGGDDCDDSNPARHPGASEVCDAMSVDEDCDPRTFGYRDVDGDGSADAMCCNNNGSGVMTCGDDCDDSQASVHPGAAETCDGRDNDCNGTIDEGVQLTFFPDRDMDGVGDGSAMPVTACAPPAGYVASTGDCDDTAPAVNPGAAEVCDAALVDENCNGTANEGCACTGTASMPCPGAMGACAAGIQTCVSGTWSMCSIAPDPESCNAIDDDCDGVVDNGVTIACYPDADDDTFPIAGSSATQVCPDASRSAVGGCPSGMTNRTPAPGSADCNDAQRAVNPAATEVCNAVDDNCNGTIDEGVTHAYYPDTDGDSYGDSLATATFACSAPMGFVPNNSDCDDRASTVHPGSTEVCDVAMADENCNGTANEGCACVGTATMPCPGAVGACAAGIETCVSGAWSACSITPQPESCNAIDDDCNGVVDDGVTVTCYADADNDTYPAPGAAASQRCPVVGRESVGGCPSGSTNRVPGSGAVDCNESNPAVNPAAPEVCNGVDDNCNGTVDEGVTTAYYPDADRDTYGNASAAAVFACSPPAGYVANNGDCSDSNAAIHPGASEVCDVAMLDENCNGTINEGCSCVGTMMRPCPGAMGVCTAGTQMCMSGAWGACSVLPATETCNGLDDDCDGMTDEGLTVTCYVDADNDTYAPSGSTASSRCPDSSRVAWGSCPVGYTARAPSTSADCDDTRATVSPARSEVCDGIDNNCNGSVDEGVQTTYYRDADGDGYGNPSSTTAACSQPGGYVTNSGDCNDADISVHAYASLYRDYDGDGYGSGTLQSVCPAAGWVGTGGDCYDNAGDAASANVHPNQTAYFGTSYVGGTSTAPGCTGFFPACWDYNCDNTNTPEPQVACAAVSCAFTACQSGVTNNTVGCGNSTVYDTCGGCGGGGCAGVVLARAGHALACR